MITSEKYIAFVKETFSYLIDELDYEVGNIKINGNIFYDVEFKKTNKVISISLETLENYPRVIIFNSDGRILSDYDNRTKTIHLNELTKEILPNLEKINFELNEKYFEKFKPETETEKLILKSAKELRICLKNKNKNCLLQPFVKMWVLKLNYF